MKRFAVLLCVAIAAAIACSDDGTGPAVKGENPVPTSLAKVSGDGQTGTVGSALSQGLTVRVTDQNGSAMGGITVNWTVASGGGSVSSSSSSTASNGQATVTWTLGTVAGETSATASVAGISTQAVFAATGEPDRPAKVTVSEDTVSFTAVGDTVDVAASVEDRHGNAIPSAPLTWSTGDSLVATVDADGRVVSRGQGSAPIAARADTANGTAVVNVEQLPARVSASPGRDTLNALADTATFTAAVYDDNGNEIPDAAVAWSSLDETIATVSTTGRAVAQAPGTVLVTATAGAMADTAALLVRQLTAAVSVSPSADTLTAGDTLRLAATASDSNGFGIAEASFAWASSDTAVASVDAVGLAHGKVARSATITATNAGVSGAADLTVVPGPAASISMFAGDAQTGPAGEPLPDSLVIQVADAYGNAIADEPISWTTAAGHGSPSATSSTSSTGGVAKIRWTLGLHSGTDTLAASHPAIGAEPITFTATATANGRITGTISLSSALQSSTSGAARTAAGVISTRDKAPLAAGGAGALDPSASARGKQTPDYVPGSLIVRYRSEAVDAPRSGSREFTAAATAAGVSEKLTRHIRERGSELGFELRGVSPAILSARINVEPSRVEAVMARLVNDRSVLSVERERFLYRSGVSGDRRLSDSPAATLSDDPLYPTQAWHYAMIDMPEAWTIATGSNSVVVAVVDDGIRFDHPDLTVNLTGDGYDFVSLVSGTACGYNAAGDGDGYDPDPTIPFVFNSACGASTAAGHGLHVAGTIGAAGNDGAGMTGVNWTVKVRPVRVLNIAGTGTHYDIAQGILYAAGLPADDGNGGTVPPPSRSDIINLSLGGTHSTTLQDAIQAAVSAGALVIASAGNASTSTPSYPAAYPEVVSVSAVGPDRLLASYSNYGSTVDIAAPGGDTGDWDWTFGVGSARWNFSTNQPTYDWLDGTSMAAPHVSGVAALLLAHEPSLTAAQLRARLIDHAVDLGPAGRDDLYGHGLLNARNSLTQTQGPARSTHARLYDAGSGAVVQTLAADAGGNYTFTALEDGDYYVYAGEDRDGDGLIGIAGRRWGTYTSSGTAAPGAVSVHGAGDYSASFSLGFANELEPNDSPGSANLLPIGGHFHGRLSTASEADYFVVTVPSAGTYTFETSGWDGACGYAYEEDTILVLYGSDGSTVLASNDDVDYVAGKYCSRIDVTLSAGTYYLDVTGYYGMYYRVEARPAA